MALLDLEISNQLFSADSRREWMAKAKQSLLKSDNLSNQQLVKVWVILGKSYAHEKQTILVENAYQEVIKIIDPQDKKLLSEVYEDTGFSLAYLVGDCSKAIAYYQKAKDFLEELNETKALIDILHRLSHCYEELSQWQQVEHHLKLAILYADDYPITKARFLTRLSVAFKETGSYHEAIEAVIHAQSIFEKEEMYEKWRKCTEFLLDLYEHVNDQANAEKLRKLLDPDPLTREEILDGLNDSFMKTRIVTMGYLVENRKNYPEFDVISILYRMLQDPEQSVRDYAEIYLLQLKE